MAPEDKVRQIRQINLDLRKRKFEFKNFLKRKNGSMISNDLRNDQLHFLSEICNFRRKVNLQFLKKSISSGFIIRLVLLKEVCHETYV